MVDSLGVERGFCYDGRNNSMFTRCENELVWRETLMIVKRLKKCPK